MHITEVLDKKHGQHIIFVDAGIYAATEGVAGFPHSVIDVFLGYFSH
jgi:hypothetical protein